MALIGAHTPTSAHGTTAIVGAIVFDATGAAPHPATVLIEGDRIVSVGPNVKVPAGAKVIDAKGEALLPGFYDLHTHCTPSGDRRQAGHRQCLCRGGITASLYFNSASSAFVARCRLPASLAVAPHVSVRKALHAGRSRRT